MKGIINEILHNFEYLIFSKRALRKHTPKQLTEYYGIEKGETPVWVSTLNAGLKGKLINEGKIKWSEIVSEAHLTNISHILIYPLNTRQ